ncbi:MAG: glycosyltransferase [Parcubacteria group bacterium]|nr:glycosyltransferase [Parcubacteria group bacterium]
MKVALVHDFLNQVGGAEKDLEIFHELYPKAPVYTLTYDKKETRGLFEDMDIRTSFIQKLPGGSGQYKWYLTLMPAAIERLDLSSYDVVLSDSSAYSKGVIVQPDTLHISYCHSPTRYLWNDTHSYTEELKQPAVVKRMLPLVLNKIRQWDRVAADRVDKYIANSKTVAHRIEKYYRRESDVIYPPVETDKFYVSKSIGDYYLIISRLRPYKRVDLAVEAFNALEYPLKVIGTGEEYDNLKRKAKKNIEFLGHVSDEEKSKYLSSCRALIYPQEEDFGISAVEAMASGRPVIALRKGGARETIKEGITGEFFNEQTPWKLVDKIREFDAEKYDPEVIREHAKQYDIKLFKDKIRNYIEVEYNKYQEKIKNTHS